MRIVRTSAALLGATIALMAAPVRVHAAAPEAADTRSSEQRALALFEQSAKEYREGHFAEAVRLLREAYVLKPAPVLLYNLARAYDAMASLDDALDAYTRYLHDDPSAKDRGAIEQRVATLKKQIQERDEAKRRAQQAAAAPPPAPPPPPPPPRRSPSTLPWIVAGAGGAGLIAGVVFGVLARSRHSAANSDGGQQAAADDQSAADTFALVSTVSFIAGGVLAAGGLTWGIIDLGSASRPSDASRANHAQLRFGAGWVSLGGSFD